MTDEPQRPSSPVAEPVTEERPAAVGEPPTAPLRDTPPVTPAAETRPPLPPPVPPAVESGPPPGPSPLDKATALVDERPEVGVGAAFAGGIVFALILKRLGR